MFKLPDSLYRKFPADARFWLTAWAVWFVTLWFLSSGSPSIQNGPKIPHLDKVMHFGYFAIGGFTLSNFLHLKFTWPAKKILLITLLIGASVGALDEFHQSFTPTRSGNDPYDWIADAIGTLSGSLYCLAMWRRFKPVVNKKVVSI